MLNNNEILTKYIINNTMIDKAIKGLYIKSDLVDDFRSHFYLIILEYDNQELNDKINKGYLLWWCLNVLKNQSGNKSSFFTIFVIKETIIRDRL